MTEMTYTETLVVMHCWCGIALAIPKDLYQHARQDAKNAVYCPLGHEFVFGNTYKMQLTQAEERLAEEQRRVRATRDLLAAEERSHTATKGHLTRVRRRVEHGVCPHCNRSFQDLRRHMRSKHRPEMKQTDA